MSNKAPVVWDNTSNPSQRSLNSGDTLVDGSGIAYTKGPIGGLYYIPSGSYAAIPQGLAMPVYGNSLTIDGALYLDGRLLNG